MEYKVTMYIKAVTHPRKWLVEGINDMLNEDESEDILEWEIEPMEYIEND
tara:strand:- start:75 stop:224 length:150 start_codon:yes stop_codon:yes gene_type:complete